MLYTTSRPVGQTPVTAPQGIGLLGVLVLIPILSLVILLGWRDRGPAGS